MKLIEREIKGKRYLYFRSGKVHLLLGRLDTKELNHLNIRRALVHLYESQLHYEVLMRNILDKIEEIEGKDAQRKILTKANEDFRSSTKTYQERHKLRTDTMKELGDVYVKFSDLSRDFPLLDKIYHSREMPRDKSGKFSPSGKKAIS